MKKLMIAAAIVCAAAMVQASSVNWSYTGKTNDDTVKGGHIYLIQGTAPAEITGTFAAWLADQTVASDKGITWSTVPNKLGKVSVFETTNDKLDKDHSYYFVLVNSDESKYQLSNAAYGTGDGETPIVYGGQDPQITTALTGASSFGSWQDVKSVPEPTSAMLLLLGVAGLALRRKQK